jgi:GNAT superfamily N-acetyltransferase
VSNDGAVPRPPLEDAPELAGDDPAAARHTTVDRVGPGGTVASDSAFGVALVSLWQHIADSGAPVGFATPVSRLEVSARVAELVEGLRKGTVVGVAANRARRLVGVGLLRPGRGIRRHTGRVEVLLVHPDQAGDGLGSALLSDLLRMAADRGIERVDLEMQDDDRLAAFFGRFGFTEWGRRPSWLRLGPGHVRDQVILGATLPDAG